MIWFFRRGEQTTSVEVRIDSESKEFVITTTSGDAPAQVERYTNYNAFVDRVNTLEGRLERQEWRQDGPPILLPIARPPTRD